LRVKLAAITPALVQRAIAVYQEVAYGPAGIRPISKAPQFQDFAGSPCGEAVLAQFQREQVGALPGRNCCRYSLRLGNRNYPFMKLLLQEHLVAGEYYFAVDTHDQMELAPTYPDYEQWQAVRRFNAELKRQIEVALGAAGLETCATLRQQILDRPGQSTSACRGLVLIVDDEADLAEAVALLLQRVGFRTCMVHDGPAGVVAAQELQPDLLVLDYELPELDGLQVLAQLRQDARTRRLPVLLCSAGRVTAAEVAAADAFLAKPFPESLLYERIDQLLTGRVPVDRAGGQASGQAGGPR